MFTDFPSHHHMHFISIRLVTEEVTPFVETSYAARTEKELPVLNRFVAASKLGEVKPAQYLDLILYSREQIIEENKAMGNTSDDKVRLLFVCCVYIAIMTS